MGIRARWVWWANTKETIPRRQHHMTLEAYLEESDSWQLMDPHYGLLFHSGFSALNFALCDHDAQKAAIQKSLPKDHFQIDDLESYDSSVRLFAVQTVDQVYISPINPNVDEALHLRFLAHLAHNLRLLPLDEFCHVAGYTARPDET